MIELNRLSPAAEAGLDMKIKIIGIGGAGSNILDRLVLDGIDDVDLVAMNTDVQSLTQSVARDKVQLGREATRGLGAGGDPEVGLAAADEAGDEIRQAVEGASILFICVGLGGGTGSGSAALIAALAKEHHALVVVFATLPFAFEGKRRRQQAEEALFALQKAADVVICFENDRMGESISPKAGIHQAFANADQTIGQSVKAVCGLIHRTGLIHLGFDDLSTALRNNNARCLFGFGDGEGGNRAHEALAVALKNPLMDKGRMLADATNVLVNIAGGQDMTLNEVQVLMEELGRHIGEQTQILFGAAVDPKMNNRMSVTIISSIAVGEHAPAPRASTPLRERPAPPVPVSNGRASSPPAAKVENKTSPEEPEAEIEEAEELEPEPEQPSLVMETPPSQPAPAEVPAGGRSKNRIPPAPVSEGPLPPKNPRRAPGKPPLRTRNPRPLRKKRTHHHRRRRPRRPHLPPPPYKGKIVGFPLAR